MTGPLSFPLCTLLYCHVTLSGTQLLLADEANHQHTLQHLHINVTSWSGRAYTCGIGTVTSAVPTCPLPPYPPALPLSATINGIHGRMPTDS